MNDDSWLSSRKTVVRRQGSRIKSETNLEAKRKPFFPSGEKLTKNIEVLVSVTIP